MLDDNVDVEPSLAWGLAAGISVDGSISDRRSTFNVDGGLDVYVAVEVEVKVKILQVETTGRPARDSTL